jgi:uncharacterized protein YkwD
MSGHCLRPVIAVFGVLLLAGCLEPGLLETLGGEEPISSGSQTSTRPIAEDAAFVPDTNGDESHTRLDASPEPSEDASRPHDALLVEDASGPRDPNVGQDSEWADISTADSGPDIIDVPDVIELPTCGNGAIEPGETCDPPGSCPTSCNDGSACTVDTMSGSAATCNVRCTHTAITSCVSGDGCCPAGCTNANDSDCPPPNDPCSGVNACANADQCCPSGCFFDTDNDCLLDCRNAATWPRAWTDFEVEVVRLFNVHRAAGADCRTQGVFPPAPALTMHTLVHQASRCHSVDQWENGFMSHTGSDGSTLGQRLTREGYNWSAVGENVARGQSTPANVVNSWMSSDGHCRNIMNSNYVHVGIGFVHRSWTAKFAKPR